MRDLLSYGTNEMKTMKRRAVEYAKKDYEMTIRESGYKDIFLNSREKNDRYSK